MVRLVLHQFMISYIYDLISLYEFIEINTSLLAPWMTQLVLQQFMVSYVYDVISLYEFIGISI